MKRVNVKKWGLLLTLLILGSIGYLRGQNHWIEVENIEINVENRALNGVKIVHISDVHLPRPSSVVENLVHLVEEEQPGLILMTGDIIDRRADLPTSGLQELVTQLVAIAPVYGVSGNHEQSSGSLEEWRQIMVENGVQLLDDAYEIVEINGVKVALLGLEDADTYTQNLFQGINSDYSILLVHRPILWETYYPKLQPDLVLSGHAHGGQVRLPFIGGIVAPHQGFFPTYTSGFYVTEQGNPTIISRGLGNSVFPIRIHNRLHLPVITFKS